MTDSMNSTSLKRLCLVTAVDIEFKTATSLLAEKTFSVESRFKICRGVVSARAVTVLQSGMGARGFADWLADHLKTNSYDTLMVVGLAGGLDPRLKTGDAVVYDCCLDAREANENATPSAIQHPHGQADLVRALLDALRETALSSFYGSGITVSRVVINAQDKLWLGQQHQALAVDMESFDALQVAAKRGVPAAVVRVISDEAEHDLPDFNFAAEADGTVNTRRMATAMLQRPAASTRFLRSLKPVLAALRNVLEVVVRV
ncbi:MAG: hypothetical protein SF097_19555 [Acidobacteriota bacterium]|nr:hypothetical protein [Acidobacteriota bacterium]